jgi:putative nucleotidyltransferase with HDIG domain
VKSIFPRFKPARRVNGLGKIRAKNPTGHSVPRLILAFFVMVSLYFMYISSAAERAGLIEYSLPELKAGDISPVREVAMIDFQVPKPPDQLEEERRRAAANVTPVFSVEREPLLTVRNELESLFATVASMPSRTPADSLKRSIEAGLPGQMTYRDLEVFRQSLGNNSEQIETVRSAMLTALESINSNLIVARKDDLRYYSTDFIMIEDSSAQRIVGIDSIMDVAVAGDSLGALLSDALSETVSARNLRNIRSIAVRYIRPNLSYNARRTGEFRSQAMDAVPVHSASYKKNERIIEENVPVSAGQIAALEAYRRELETQAFSENRLQHYAVAIGKSLIAYGILGIVAGYLSLNRKKIFKSISKLSLLTIIAGIPLSIAYYTAWGGEVSSFLVPVAVATILATILFDSEVGIMMSVAVSLLVVTLIPGESVRLGLIYFLGGGMGALTVGKVRHRKEFYRSMFSVPLTMVLAVAATHDWLSGPSMSVLGKDMFIAALNGFFCPIIAIGLLPLLESVFKVATDITLLELSDLNNPLLKEVAVKAPGTFSSVLMVGALAEAAAERIGANPLLARVGSYYHDIGKSVIPEYFIENQYGGENPHDRLSPHMSALVIASHVKEGYELGLRYGLPEAILDIIRQHHGTSLMASIYHKAQEKAGDDTVDESAFRYPGPKPQTREAGIVMLADLVEAASRSLSERTPGRLKNLINTIIEKRFLEGELDECDLTLKDLHLCQEAFLPVLVGSYHGRIEYPWQKEARESQASNQNSVRQTDTGGDGKAIVDK